MNPVKSPQRGSVPKIVIDKPLFIAAHFGFVPMEAPRIQESDREMTADCLPAQTGALNAEPGSGRLVCDASEKAAFIRICVERGLHNAPQPLALSWRRGSTYSLELVGYPFGVAEAKLIRTALSILKDEGHEGMTVEINSIGDKDSITAYERELQSYLRKIQHNLSPELRKLLKDDIFNLVESRSAELDPMRAALPASIATLSTPSRAQFKEVIAYLEALGVDFRFAPDLIGNKHFCSESLFTIRGADNVLLAGGYRYSRLGKRFGLKKELAFMGATVFCQSKALQAKIYKDLPRPKFYFIHLGRMARMKALSLIETLRDHHIPLAHLLGRDKLLAQMQLADASRAPYLLIVGQKEALEDTVTVRNVSTRAQDTICMHDLPLYLKHLPF